MVFIDHNLAVLRKCGYCSNFFDCLVTIIIITSLYTLYSLSCEFGVMTSLISWPHSHLTYRNGASGMRLLDTYVSLCEDSYCNLLAGLYQYTHTCFTKGVCGRKCVRS